LFIYRWQLTLIDNLKQSNEQRKQISEQKKSVNDNAEQRNKVIASLNEQIDSYIKKKMTRTRRSTLLQLLIFLCEKRSASVKEMMAHTRLSRASMSRYIKLMKYRWIQNTGWRENEKFTFMHIDLKMPDRIQ